MFHVKQSSINQKDNTMNTQEFIKTINTLRLENKNKWYQWQGEVNGKQVALKGYNTWVQRLNVDNITYGSRMEEANDNYEKLENSVNYNDDL